MWLFLNGYWHKPRYRVAQQSRDCVFLTVSNYTQIHPLGKLNTFYCKSEGPTQNFPCINSPNCKGNSSIKLPLMQLPWDRHLELYLHKLFCLRTTVSFVNGRNVCMNNFHSPSNVVIVCKNPFSAGAATGNYVMNDQMMVSKSRCCHAGLGK